MASKGNNVLFFLAVGRLVKENGEYVEGQHQVIASAPAPGCEAQEKDYKVHVKQIMDKGATRLTPGKRIRLTADDGNYDLHVMPDTLEDDSLLVYFAVTSTGFGKAQSVPKLLDEFKAGFLSTNHMADIEKAKEKGSVNKNSQQLFAKLFATFGTDKLKNVQDKVDQVKEVMKDNVNKALTNVDALDELEGKSEQFESQAKQFEKNAGKAKNMMRCREIKMIAIIALIVIIIIIIIVVATLPKN